MKREPWKNDVSRRSFLRRGLLSIGGWIALGNASGREANANPVERERPNKTSDHPARHFVKGKDLAG